MDIETTNEIPQTDSFAAELAKTLIVSAVSTVGTVLGFVALSVVVTKVQDVKKDRETKKSEKNK